METVTIQDARTRLSQLIARAVAGEPFIISKAGKPLVTVTRIEQPEPKTGTRRLGFLEGQIDIPEDGDESFQEEIEALFYGDPADPK